MAVIARRPRRGDPGWEQGAKLKWEALAIRYGYCSRYNDFEAKPRFTFAIAEDNASVGVEYHVWRCSRHVVEDIFEWVDYVFDSFDVVCGHSPPDCPDALTACS